MVEPAAGALASFETTDGHTLSYESWRDPQAAAGTPPITVVFLHGVHESTDTLVCAFGVCFRDLMHMEEAYMHTQSGRARSKTGAGAQCVSALS